MVHRSISTDVILEIKVISKAAQGPHYLEYELKPYHTKSTNEQQQLIHENSGGKPNTKNDFQSN